jgi:hypothetical protein
MRRDKSFRESDDARALASGLAYQSTRLFGRCLAIEEDGSRLHSSHLNHRIYIAHRTYFPLVIFVSARSRLIVGAFLIYIKMRRRRSMPTVASISAITVTREGLVAEGFH